ncbi:chemotaxis protein CheB [Nostoc sp. 'Peltigera malacea cyanobiont' DB3992]|uniref:chemotaxis protein CheB n=1 Tax=Nostoc sp. 'Peltigera malacea cyanobiont' DB3992 TaxID=1206980 RepID=UPI000C051537|nr:chemotaxis protein CheB [Nostoc sp. 'Peltigera malacea cyanobiont' DB3992]PHM09280.1 chemotaxis protein CheB [Nostoc sp. 'Peltigera malacea cyanobiont' DB3992]
MLEHNIIVIGTSAGGVEALTYLVKHLPPNLNAAVIIVLHVSSHGTSVLPKILSRASNLPVSHAQDGEAIVHGWIYVALPDYHLLVERGYLRLTRGATENRCRPAIDPLFRSAARAYGQRVIAVLLTGVLDDGTAGLMAVKMRHGVAIVQNPDDALYAAMPRNAIENVEDIDHIAPLSDIPSILVALVNTPIEVQPENPVSSKIEFETEIAQLNLEAVENESERPGKPSTFGCPDCGGMLWEIEEGNLLRFRCRTGHAYSAETLLATQSDKIEDALWLALRALEEKASLSDRMAARMEARNQTLAAQRFKEEAHSARQRSAVIREVLLKVDPNTGVD